MSRALLLVGVLVLALATAPAAVGVQDLVGAADCPAPFTEGSSYRAEPSLQPFGTQCIVDTARGEIRETQRGETDAVASLMLGLLMLVGLTLALLSQRHETRARGALTGYAAIAMLGLIDYAGATGAAEPLVLLVVGGLWTSMGQSNLGGAVVRTGFVAVIVLAALGVTAVINSPSAAIWIVVPLLSGSLATLGTRRNAQGSGVMSPKAAL